MKKYNKTIIFAGLGLLFSLVSTTTSALPTGVIKTLVFSGLNAPTAIKFAPNGKVFIAEKGGRIKVFDSINDSSPTEVANLSNRTYTNVDHGLLGLAIHPNFPTTPYIYALYSNKLGSGAGRLSRLTIQNNAMTEEKILITGWCQQSTTHAIGDLNFGSDGKLYVTGGEGSHPEYADVGQNDGPGTANYCGDGFKEGGAMRSQDLMTFNDALDFGGTLLRLDPITGMAAAGNPKIGGDAKDDRIVAFGLRNPFRFTIHPSNGQIYISDVGWDSAEEINRIISATDANVENFGWPCFEGVNPAPQFQSQNIPICNTLYNNKQDTKPFYSWGHNGSQSAVTGISFYTGLLYPAQYRGALFFADYSRNIIKAALPGANGVPNPGNVVTFDAAANRVVDIESGPAGDLYSVEIENGKIFRYASLTQAKLVASFSADKTVGGLDLTVKFDASNSANSAGGTLSYAWDLDGDNNFDDSTAVAPQFTYHNAGTYIVSLKVSDVNGNYSLASQAIVVTNDVPTATILSPSPSLLWKTGDTVNFSGEGFIPSSGDPAESLQWKIEVYHCWISNANDCHKHTVTTPSGASGSFVAPDHEYPSQIDLTLTAVGPVFGTQWWNTNWEKRRWLFFNNLQQGEILNNFPVLVKLDANRIDYASAGTNGASLRFVSSAGALLPFEIEEWNPAGTSTVWVKVPTIAANSAKQFIWMYYGNPAATNGQNPAAVWSGDFVGVWHLNGNSNDASPLSNNGTNIGATDVAGKFGKGRYFNGNAYVNVPSSASLSVTSEVTLEAWVKVQNAGLDSFSRIISKKKGFNDSSGYDLEYNAGQNLLSVVAGNFDFARGQTVDLDASWHYVAATVNGANGKVFVDGVDRTSDSSIGALTGNATALNIGRSALGNEYFLGSLDEVRVSNVGRGAGWVKAQSRSMSDKFIYYTDEETRIALKGTAKITLRPETSRLTVTSNPAGLKVGLNSQSGAAPLSQDVIVNASTQVIAPTPQTRNATNWEFNCWNDANCAQSRVFSAGAADKTLTANYTAAACTTKYPAMNFRGTPNAFGLKAMVKNAACVWETTVHFGTTTTERFKFDASTNWTLGFGDTNKDGIAELGGDDITIAKPGCDYKITFNDKTLAYSKTPVAGGCVP